MADKKSHTSQWLDPKDYGLPYVEVKPLADAVGLPSISEETESKEAEGEDLSAAALRAKMAQTVKPKVSHELLEEEDDFPQKEPIQEKIKETPKDAPVKEPKKKSNWAIYAVFIGILLISAVVWQLMKEDTADPRPIENNLAENSSEAEPSPGKNDANTSLNEEEEGVVNQDSSIQESSPVVESAPIEESGTTIEQSAVDSLIRVDSKATRPQYFIVVGSLPNERLAIEESSQYYDRVNELFLILPYEDVPNYRLAIGRFNSFTQANNQLEQIKDQYTEALWILKY
ncbi:SPOR domain-containing protein [Algoriphagus hitonicola]|uniref:Sporulation related domain-containing protein n=1 Tax=Algoriphagus hitonicola TaxID=435880 RepID=A0A1I2X9V2_9BACT|nr:SPOR domain-containing protein [Algoriphagus hitonicola]SFH10182.1 hypothetical protein SAMN04487988_11732 [Algoriphagus hitonicola]